MSEFDGDVALRSLLGFQTKILARRPDDRAYGLPVRRRQGTPGLRDRPADNADPAETAELLFTQVFDYEVVLMVHGRSCVGPQDLLDEELISVPVPLERPDVYMRFLVPAHCWPRQHRTAETIDLMLQLVCAGRGVTFFPIGCSTRTLPDCRYAHCGWVIPASEEHQSRCRARRGDDLLYRRLPEACPRTGHSPLPNGAPGCPMSAASCPSKW
ncbi:LysR family transcriptional regulator [Mesorhizobium sp. J8]|nr:LysR family transcriptional regulator [Mesorhizobium sp. J8]